MNHFSPRVYLIVLLLLLHAALLSSTPTVRAQTPEATRPYLELPFPGETSYRLTCGYGCYQHGGSMSYAVDFDVPEGEPIAAAADGTVMAVTWEVGLPLSLNLGDALIIYIDHGDGWFTRYVHLSGITVKAGDEVIMGQIIGYGGKTGASADHLHFELKYGNSLHSPSVPINELFGGADPEAGRSYRSNNRPLWDLRPTVAAAEPTAEPTATGTPEPAPLTVPVEIPTSTATPPTVGLDETLLTTTSQEPASLSVAPIVDDSFESRLPKLDVGLTFSQSSVQQGEPVTATFTLRNTSTDRLRLSMLGVGGHGASEAALENDTIFFDRSITLNPGRSYTFSRQHIFNKAGDLELFVFALGPGNEWLPLRGDGLTANLTVERAPSRLYLPFAFGTAPDVDLPSLDLAAPADVPEWLK